MNLRVGMINPSTDPVAPHEWSGTPFGLKGGFEAGGAEVHAFGHYFPPVIREIEAGAARLGGLSGPRLGRAPTRIFSRSLSLRWQLRRAPRLDMALAMGTDAFRLQDLSLDCPVVTYDDGTLHQQWSHPNSDIANGGFRSRDVERWIRIQRDSIRAADAVCVSTNWAKRSFVEDYGVPADRVHVVGMGHRPRRSGSEGRDWSRPTFLFVGVDWRRKNGDAVLRAFAQLQSEFPDATLHLVGEHDRVEGRGVIDHGHLRKDDPAAQAELDTLFTTATAFVLPSLFDPSPIAYLEAASAGLPVVATDQGGAAELLGEAALTVDPLDDAAVLAAMLSLTDPDRARSLGQQASEAASRSSWRFVAARILAAAGLDDNHGSDPASNTPATADTPEATT